MLGARGTGSSSKRRWSAIRTWRRRLPAGGLPLRLLLRQQSLPGLFALLAQHGAEHDILTASAATNVEVVDRLLQQGPHLVHETDEEGNTPLHWACVQRGYSPQPCDTVGLVQRLVAAGGDVNARNELGLTPLDRSILDGGGEACEVLIEYGATPSVLLGVVSEDYELLDAILDNEPDQVHWREERSGQSLLHVAVQWECEPRMFDYLIARGARAELETRVGRAGKTPLLLAICSGHSEAAEALIKLGANVHARQQRPRPGLWNCSALELAISGDRVGLAEMLIARGADAGQLASHGRTLLCLASSEEMTELLVRSGIDLSQRDHNGQSPLDHAIEEGRLDVARALIRHGAEGGFFEHVALGECDRVRAMLDRQPELIRAYRRPPSDAPASPPTEDSLELPWGSLGGTVLHYAAKSGSLNMVRLLLDRGADVNAATEPGKWTPLHDATYYTIYRDLRYGEKIIRLLVEAGADLHARTWGGYRPLDIADYLSFCDRSAEIFDLLMALERQHGAGAERRQGQERGSSGEPH